MVVVLVDEITNRVDYAFDFIFGIRGVEYKVVKDPNQFAEFDGVKLNYSQYTVDNSISLKPSGVLNNTDIWTGELNLFKSDSIEFLSFDGVEDLIASVFYILTRMEEYECEGYDEHGRFPFSQSVLKRNHWIEKAMCDRWADYLIQNVLKIETHKSEGQFIPTFDIDNTYAYHLKTGRRKTLSTIKDVVKLNWERLKERKIVNNGGKDPYDTFDKIIEVAKKHKLTRVFWLTKGNGAKDRNISIENPDHKSLIKEVSKSAELNIHPSYDSFLNSSEIQKEKEGLESITGKQILSSRQHFLRFQLPSSYRDLIKAGIREDYSMGFAEHIGFRSGTARSHYWFDLQSNELTELLIHPFAYMDGTLLEYMEMTTDQSKVKIKEIFDEVQQFGGDFVFIWHNETIGDYNKWNGWSEVLDFTLNMKNE